MQLPRVKYTVIYIVFVHPNVLPCFAVHNANQLLRGNWFSRWFIPRVNFCSYLRFSCESDETDKSICFLSLFVC